MKKLILCFAVCLAMVLFAPKACALELPPEVRELLDEPRCTAEDFLSMGFSESISALVKMWKAQLEKPFRMLLRLIAFLLMGAVVTALCPAEHWSHILEMIVMSGAFLLTAQPVMDLMFDVADTIQNWYHYLTGFVPVFAGVMLGCGQSSTAMVYSGMFLTMAHFSAQLICTAAMPLLQVYLSLCVAGGFCGTDGLQQGCELIGKGVRWILKFVALLFGAVLGLQTLLAQGTDNLAAKAGQFVLSSTIPVVGAAASEAMGSVLAALRVVKGSLGFAAAAVLAASFLPLLLRCIAYVIVLAAGVFTARAAGFEQSGNVLSGILQSIGLCISFLAFFFMLVTLSTALMILTGNGG